MKTAWKPVPGGRETASAEVLGQKRVMHSRIRKESVVEAEKAGGREEKISSEQGSDPVRTCRAWLGIWISFQV